MSAMSASSPPSGLMPLSLISEHKSAVPGVQQLQRTPEKMNPPTTGAPNALPPQTGQPPKVTLGVANGMEAAQPTPLVPHHQPQEAHPPGPVDAPVVAVPPPSQLPNLPSGGDQGGVPEKAPLDVPTAAPVLSQAPIPEIRLPTASGLTITPIPASQALPQAASQPVALPPSLHAQPPPAVPAEPQSTNVIPLPPVSVPAVSVAETVGGANLPASRPAETKEAKPTPPERPAEKTHAVPSEPVTDKAAPLVAAQPPVKDVAPHSAKPLEPVKPAAPPAPVKDQEPGESAAPTQPTSSAPSQPEPTAASAEKPAPSTPADTPTAQSSASQSGEATPAQPPKPKRTPKPKPTPDAEKKTPAKETPSDKDGDSKPRRKRLPTQPYQSPIPELNLIAKINKIDKTPSKPQEDKLIVFYRNEFLAVRNAEGSYYVCQAMQNIYKTSSKIKIRWLSQDPNGENYTPDFYDHTEFDCILTNLNLQRVGKDQFKLPEIEAKRTDSILKRAIDVEKGVVVPDESTITEEHPDGLDLSLFRNEDQLKKRKKNPRKSPKSAKRRSDSARRSVKSPKPTPEPTKKLPSRSTSAAKRKSAPAAKRVAAKKPSPPSTPAPVVKKETKKEAVSTPAAKSATKRKPVAPASAPPESKRSRRDPTTKTKSAAAAVSPSTPKAPATASSSARRGTRNSK